MTDTGPRELIKRLVDEFEGWIVHAEIEDIERAHDLVDEARSYIASTAEPQISEEENERRFRECLRIIQNTTHEDLVELMGEDFLEEFRRASQR
jgi:hypothetical protein